MANSSVNHRSFCVITCFEHKPHTWKQCLNINRHQKLQKNCLRFRVYTVVSPQHSRTKSSLKTQVWKGLKLNLSVPLTSNLRFLVSTDQHHNITFLETKFKLFNQLWACSFRKAMLSERCVCTLPHSTFACPIFTMFFGVFQNKSLPKSRQKKRRNVV